MNSLNIILRSYFIFLIYVSLANCQSVQLYLSSGSPCPNGICTQLELCQSAKDLISQGKQPTICSFVQNSSIPIVCCQNNEKKNNVENQNISKKSISEQKCDEYKNIVVHRSTSAIVGTQTAQIGEFPHMAIIGYEDGNKIEWLCGGSLISERYVLIAAHCTVTHHLGTAKYVKLGVWDISRENENHQTFSIEQIIVHPDYKRPLFYHDIALIKLNATVQFNSSTNLIKPACLNIERNITKSRLIATGWGPVSYGEEVNPLLQKVTLDLISQEQCNKTYNSVNTRNLPYGIVDDYQICAGSFKDYQGSCQKEFGGPLQSTYYREDDKNIHMGDTLIHIIGITSFGKTCAVANIPDVYTRVSTYVPWIERIVWST